MDRAQSIELTATTPTGLLDWLTLSCRHVALLAAMLATGGSLFFSEVLGWIPVNSAGINAFSCTR